MPVLAFSRFLLIVDCVSAPHCGLFPGSLSIILEAAKPSPGLKRRSGNNDQVRECVRVTTDWGDGLNRFHSRLALLGAGIMQQQLA